ncbi:MAG: cytochrome c [Comamonas sp.]
MSAARIPRFHRQPPVGPGLPGPRWWLRIIALCALLAVAALAWLLWRGSAAHAPLDGLDSGGSAAPSTAVLERGAYLVRIGACMGCHTAQGGAVLAGGGEVRTPFGVFHAPNLTPDAATGLGRWSLADFRRAMRHGVAPGGRLLYPAFPYEQYTALRTADVDAIFHYLRSLPPVAQPAQPHQLRFPYGSQWALALWRGLYFQPADAASQQVLDTAPQEVGRYLVQAVTHCAACHSPRNGLGALGGGQRLEGGLMPTEGWQAPSLLDSREAGVQRWAPEAVVQLLRTGRTDTGAVASGPMADAVFWSTQYLTDGDARAVAVYLQGLPDAAAGAALVGVDTPEKGATPAHDSSAQAQFRHLCADCHGAQGQGGAAGAFPPLAGNRAVLRSDPGNMLRSILQGGYAPATAGNPAPHGMPPFMQQLGDAEIAALATYIRQSWGNQAPAVATMEVFRARQGRP